MTDYVWVYGVEDDATACLAAIDTLMGLPNAQGTQTFSTIGKHKTEDFWWCADGTYPKMGGKDVEDALTGVTVVHVDAPADWAEVKAACGTGIAVRMPQDKCVEFGFWTQIEIGS